MEKQLGSSHVGAGAQALAIRYCAVTLTDRIEQFVYMADVVDDQFEVHFGSLKSRNGNNIKTVRGVE